MKALTCLVVIAVVLLGSSSSSRHYRDGTAGGLNGNESHQVTVNVQLTNLKLTHFTHRGSLHVDRIELRSEDNGRNAFYIHNPTDPRYPLWAAARASINSLWPKPSEELRRSQRVLQFSERFSIKFHGPKDAVMLEAAKRCGDHLFKAVTAVNEAHAVAQTYGTIGGLEIRVVDGNFQRYPHAKMREDYELQISPNGISLVAQENWGIVRGLETLAQLVFVTRDRPTRFLIHENKIKDRPAYQHRGFMLDTARHFIQKSTLLENLEAMAMNKMNVFHWHIVDDQSFPFLSEKFPQLALKSAYAGSSYFYSVKDIKEIVEFARLRGIRVIPEFDTPDHTHSWGHALPHIMSWCRLDRLAYMGPLNPTADETFAFLKEFFTEVAQLFPDNRIHLGMDEVSTDCWRLNNTFDEFAKKNGLRSYEDLVAYYSNRLSKIIMDLPKKKQVIVWEDILGKSTPEQPLNLPPDTIIQVWITRDPARVAEWSRKYKIIRSEEWYLDSQAYGADWVKRYRFDVGNAIGGEACMWTEFQSDQTVTPHTWPSVAAVAERLWSGSAANDVVQAAPRIEEQNCRMQARGIRVGVSGGPGMCQASVAHYQPPWAHATMEPASSSGTSGDGDPRAHRLVDVFIEDNSSCWPYKLACGVMALCLVYVSNAWRRVLALITRRGRTVSTGLGGHQYLGGGGGGGGATAGLQQFQFLGLLKPGSLICCFLGVYILVWLVVVQYRE